MYGSQGRDLKPQGDSLGRPHDAASLPVPGRPSGPVPEDSVRELSGLLLGHGSHILTSVITHPFIVMRRQAQVNSLASSYNLTPWGASHIMYTVQRHQSLETYGKGLLSRFIMQGVQLVTENLVCEATNLPKEVNRYASMQRHAKHLALKTISFTLTTPLVASSFLESVQSEIGSDRAGILDFVMEGGRRVLSWRTNETTRMLPVWKIAVPVVTLSLLRYVIMSLAAYTVTNAQEERAHQEALREARAAAALTDSPLRGRHPSASTSHGVTTRSDQYFTELLSLFVGSLLGDIALYPLETVVHRLLVQGTRVVVDNVDTGIGVVPVTTRYTGFFSCLRSIVVDEGVSGLYKGFGALVAQYLVHAAVVKLADSVHRWVVESYAHGQGDPPPTRLLGRSPGKGDK